MKRRAIPIGFIVATILAGTVLFPLQLPAQSQGDILEFLVDNNTANDIITGNIGDVVVFTGRSQGTVAVGDCAAGDRHLQPAVIIDPGDGRATRVKDVIPTSQETPVRSGTRVGNLQPLGPCNNGQYQKFQGTVE